MFEVEPKIGNKYSDVERLVIHHGNCLEMLKGIPDESIQLVVTSPPYNIGKEYEKRLEIDAYISQQKSVIQECARVLKPEGSICWQVGNYVDNGEIIPLDVLLYKIFNELGLVMRNRIIWHFEHGLHCRNRFSGRYETINWFTKRGEEYYFNLDPVRVPQKYPNKKHFKGPNIGKLSGNPLGKNPSDVWDIPNVKSNHVEKTDHPCQFPVGLIDRLVLSMTREGDWVLDPFMGSGTALVSAFLNNRRGIGAEVVDSYIEIAKDRLNKAANGTLRIRPMNKPIYQPPAPAREEQLSFLKKVSL